MPRASEPSSGRETDVRDAEWIGQLFERGWSAGRSCLLQTSRRLRMLTRPGVADGRSHPEATRLEGMLEDASIRFPDKADPRTAAFRARGMGIVVKATNTDWNNHVGRSRTTLVGHDRCGRVLRGWVQNAATARRLSTTATKRVAEPSASTAIPTKVPTRTKSTAQSV